MKVYTDSYGKKYCRWRNDEGVRQLYYLSWQEVQDLRRKPRQKPRRHVRKSMRNRQKPQRTKPAQEQTELAQDHFIDNITKLIRADNKGLWLVHKWPNTEGYEDKSDGGRHALNRTDVVEWYQAMCKHHTRASFRFLKKYVFDCTTAKFLTKGLVTEWILEDLVNNCTDELILLVRKITREELMNIKRMWWKRRKKMKK